MRGLWKSTIIVWSEFDPQNLEINELAKEAIDGDAYCSSSVAEYVQDPEVDPQWDNTEFFAEQ